LYAQNVSNADEASCVSIGTRKKGRDLELVATVTAEKNTKTNGIRHIFQTRLGTGCGSIPGTRFRTGWRAEGDFFHSGFNDELLLTWTPTHVVHVLFVAGHRGFDDKWAGSRLKNWWRGEFFRNGDTAARRELTTKL